MSRVKLDRIDRRILSDLQEHGRMTNVELAKRAGISARRASLRSRVPARHGLGVRTASIEPALPALRLREQAVEAFGEVGHPPQRTGMPGSAAGSASSSARRPASKPADRIIPSLTPKRILRGARLAMNTTLRPTSVSGSP